LAERNVRRISTYSVIRRKSAVSLKNVF